MTHWKASGGGSWLGATEEVATGRPQATRSRVEAKGSAVLVKVWPRTRVVESERPSEEGRSKYVLQYNRSRQKKSMKPMAGVMRVFFLPTVAPPTLPFVHS
jgi:hypothetical protein